MTTWLIIKPYGYSIWESIQKFLDPLIKSLGCRNAYFPSLIPESFLSKEKEHVEGFSPEFAVVTYAGGKKLKEPLVVRPTSETIIYSLFSKWITSQRDLPFRVNQWVNIVRWELRPLPFLRTTEFLWHEAHTAHASKKESDKQITEALRIYKELFEKALAIPVILGKKTEREKFAGALYSTSCEALLIDGKGLQIATAHNLGRNFSIPFDIAYQNTKGERINVWQTSWGLSTRAIGGLVLTHGDKKGLILPPNVAPIQVIIIPIGKAKELITVMAHSKKILSKLEKQNIRVEIDESDHSPGWKYNEWELRGVPLRIEIGPRDIANNQLVIARRDTEEKQNIGLDSPEETIKNTLADIQNNLFQRATDYLKSNTHIATSLNEFIQILDNKKGFIKAPWRGDSECERLIKEKTRATTRCIPFDKEKTEGKCINCGRQGKITPIWARAH